MIKNIRWAASNMVGGSEPCVWTRAGWTAADGTVYGCGCLPTTFGPPSRPLSARVLARVQRELADLRETTPGDADDVDVDEDEGRRARRARAAAEEDEHPEATLAACRREIEIARRVQS